MKNAARFERSLLPANYADRRGTLWGRSRRAGANKKCWGVSYRVTPTAMRHKHDNRTNSSRMVVGVPEGQEAHSLPPGLLRCCFVVKFFLLGGQIS